MNTHAERTALIETTLAQFEDRRAALAAAVTPSVYFSTIESHAWIITCDGYGIAFDTAPMESDGRARSVSNARTCDVMKCNRLTEIEARSLATLTKNDAGTIAKAKYWKDAYADEIASLTDVIAMLKAL